MKKIPKHFSFLFSGTSARLYRQTTFCAMLLLFGIGIAFPSTSQAQNLLIDVSVSTTTPGASDVFTYKIRYRCASITSHCFNSHITYTLPDALEVVGLPSVGGNVANAVATGNAVDISLVSPPSAGAPAGALAAGAAGILETRVRFKCGVNGVAPTPAAGAAINFTALPTFTVTGDMRVATAPPAVTVPTVNACPPNLPAPGPTDISKSNGVRVLTPGSGFNTPSEPNFGFAIPSTNSPFAIEDVIPAGVILLQGLESNANNELLTEVYVAGNWYSINNFGYAAISYDDYGGWLESVALGAQLLDDAGNPVPGCFRLVSPSGRRYTTGVERVRFSFPNGRAAPAYLGYDNFAYMVLPDAPLGEMVNCATVLTPPAGWSSQVCTNPSIITEKVVVNQIPYNWNYLGGTGLVVDGLDLRVVSGNPNLYKDALDQIVFTDISNEILRGGQFIHEQLLPPGFDYITNDPSRPNFWMIRYNPSPPNYHNTSDPGCITPLFTSISNYNNTGRTLLRWEFPGCTSGGLNMRIYYSMRYLLTQSLTNYCWDAYSRFEDGRQFYYSNSSGLFCESVYPSNICWTRPTSGGDVNSIKWVKGALDADFSRYPLTGNTNLAGNGEYEIYISTADWQDVKQLDVVDVLPFIGDGDILNGTLRGSAWSAELASAITVERYKIGTGLVPVTPDMPFGVQYTTSTNPCYLDAPLPAGQVRADVALANEGKNPGCTDFSAATPAAGARGFSFRWANATDPLQFGEYLKVTVNIRQLAGEPDNLSNGVAWNSVAFTATEEDDDELLSSEPLKVGIKMVDETTTAAIGDYVWIDDNANGRQDAGETPVPGVVVSLYDAAGQPITQTVLVNGVSTQIPVTSITNNNGYYCFPGLTPSTDYYVRLESPGNFGNGGNLALYSLTTANAAADDVDSDATMGTLAGSPVTPRPQILAPTLGPGTQTKTYDFGFICPGSITGYAWMDTDLGGDQDGGEMALSGVTVTLRDASTNAAVGSPATTSTSGTYAFSGVTPGAYYVEFSGFPAGKVPTFKNLTGNDQNDSDAGATGRTDVFYLNSCDYLDFDLGLRNPPLNPASICGTAWDDLNKDGTFQVTEPGIANIEVQLLDVNGFVLNTVTTDGNGDYCFTNLDPNVGYQVAFVPPAVGIMFSVAGPDQDVNLTTGITTATYTPTDNQTINDVDAGFMGPVSLGNQVWLDINNNGLFDNGEAVFSGLNMRLIAADGTTVLSTTTTDVNGRYVFKNLNAGTYYVEVETPATYTSSTDIATSGNPNALDSDDNGFGAAIAGFMRSNAITLANDGGTPGGANWTETDHGVFIMGMLDAASNPKAYYTVDFGFKPNSLIQEADLSLSKSVNIGTPNVGDMVTFTIMVTNDGPNDATGISVEDVVPNGYTSVGNISNGGILAGSTITWSSVSLAVGSSVSFTYNATIAAYAAGVNYVNTAQITMSDQADNDSTPNNNVSTEDDQSSAVVMPPVKVGDYTWIDTDGDGLQTAGEPDLPGVMVTIFDVATGLPVAQDIDGNPYTAVQTTDVNGAYLFDRLAPGNYYVLFDIMNISNAGYYTYTSPNVLSNSDDMNDSDAQLTTGTLAMSGNTGFLPGGSEDVTLDAGVRCNIMVEAGTPQTICSTRPVVLSTLNASISPLGLGGTWSTSGDGTFTGGTDFGTAVAYVPGPTDISIGGLTLTLTTNMPPVGVPCPVVSDSVQVTILKVNCGAFPWNGN